MKRLGRRKNKFYCDRIECLLEEIGFQWEVIDSDNAFARRSRDLDAFKGELGKSVSMMGIKKFRTMRYRERDNQIFGKEVTKVSVLILHDLRN